MMLQFFLSMLLWISGRVAQTSGASSAVQRLPQCAQECLFSAVIHSACGITDSACICATTELQQDITACVVQSCTLRQTLTTKNMTWTMCQLPVRDRSGSVRISNLVVFSIADIVALVRLFYNAFISKLTLGWDDYTILISIICGAPSVAMIDRGLIPNGLGRDVWTLPFDYITNSARWLYALEVLYFFQIMVVKLSLLFFFLRIFQKTLTRRLLKATIAFDLLWGTAFIFAAIFQCQPISFFWNSWDTEWAKSHPGNCININALAWSNAAISLALDFWMLAIPLYEIFHLQLSLHRKVSVSVMFCFGTFVTVISMLRLKSLIFFAKSKNPTWDQFDVVQWSNAEIDVAIICACLPALRSMAMRFLPNISGTETAVELELSGLGPGIWKRGMRDNLDPTLMRTDNDEILLVHVDSLCPEKVGEHV